MRIDNEARERLIKLCGMLSSEHDGERAVAALKASRILKQHGATWREFVEHTAARAGRSNFKEPTDLPAINGVRETCAYILKADARFHHLDEAESSFVIDLSNRNPARLTVKQKRWLVRLFCVAFAFQSFGEVLW